MLEKCNLGCDKTDTEGFGTPLPILKLISTDRYLNRTELFWRADNNWNNIQQQQELFRLNTVKEESLKNGGSAEINYLWEN